MRCIFKFLIFFSIYTGGDLSASSIMDSIPVDSYNQRTGWNIEEKVEPSLITPTVIDLHNQAIESLNIVKKMGPEFEQLTDGEVFVLNLADNYITDHDVPTLMGMIESYNDFTTHLRILNLSNNRLTFEGAKNLIPLLRLEQLRWLDISINNLNVSDFYNFLEEIETQARRMIILEELSLSEEVLIDQWAEKVVLLPENYTVERFFKPESPFTKAHNQYYRLTKSGLNK